MSTRTLRLFVIYGYFVCAGLIVHHALETRDADLVRLVWASIGPIAIWALGGRPDPGQLGK